MKAEAETAPATRAGLAARAADYFELTKPRISGMVVVTTLAGYYMGLRPGEFDAALLTNTLLGTAFVGSGASAINQSMEGGPDALMARTKARPVAAGRVSMVEGVLFGGALSAIGTIWLTLAVGPLPAALALASMLLYVFLYTPMKRLTDLNTMIGAIPGALPPMIGWAAAAGAVPVESWILFSILFFWQLPHFYAIAWMYREDYLQGGFRMIASDDPAGEKIFVRLSGQIIALIAASITPTIWGITDRTYYFVAFGLGLVFFGSGCLMAARKTRASARNLLLVSVIYLPLLLAGMMLCKN